jgi:DNA invertase Pin-like site-specific DNA recombinase
MKRAIELIRVSTESQAAEDRASIPAQRAINRRTALAHGLTIARSIEISDVSGAAVLLAPEIQELVTLMNDAEIHGVIAREFSRLMRPENFSDYALLQAFADSNTILYLPEGPIDFSSKTGRLMGTIRAAIAGMERTEILERIWSAKEEKRRTGGFGQGRVCLPYGVNYDGAWSYTADAEKVKEAFRLVLAGNTSYSSVARQLGLEPYNLRVILRNRIYTGWRVIDEKRDHSPAGKYSTKNGRQGDRRKVKRAPEDVIRVNVLEPLISESDFERVQEILDLKKEKSWRHIEGFEHRFTYNGFLACACSSTIYTKYRRDDYYICRDRCGAHYMRRDRLDPQLDLVFAKRLTSASFLKARVKTLKQDRKGVDREKLAAQLDSLASRRQRILDSYFEGVINPTERDTRLAEVERQRKVAADLIERTVPAGFDVDRVAKVFRAFVSFDELKRDRKRSLLNTITPEIIVKDYVIEGVSFVPEISRTDTDSSPPPT